MTSVLVIVAAEPGHLDETLCSSSFGKRLANVVTRAAVVLGSDAEAEEGALRARLAEVGGRARDCATQGLRTRGALR